MFLDGIFLFFEKSEHLQQFAAYMSIPTFDFQKKLKRMWFSLLYMLKYIRKPENMLIVSTEKLLPLM